MKLAVFNGEPDGRMYIEAMPEGQPLLVVSVDAIDALARNIKDHCGSEGDGCPFQIDLNSGEIQIL